MKLKSYTVFILLIAFSMTGCASTTGNAHYDQMLKEHSFGYFFPSSAFAKEFSNIDDAYEYVNLATMKIRQTLNDKTWTKGLGARMFGPTIGDAPVTIICLIHAWNDIRMADLSDIQSEEEFVRTLRREDSVRHMFFVFYGDRAISLSDFYLDPKYHGYTDGNAQVPSFNIGDDRYELDYPIGWGIDKTFSYLKKEIN